MKTTQKFAFANVGVTLSCAFLIGATPALADPYPSSIPSVYVSNAASLQVVATLTSADNRTWYTIRNSRPISAGGSQRITFSNTADNCIRYLKFVWVNGEFTRTNQLNVCQNPSIRITRAGRF